MEDSEEDINEQFANKEKILNELQDKAQSDSAVPRRSERAKVPTEKMLTYQREEISKKEKRLLTLYEQWKIRVRETRERLKLDISEKEMADLADDVEQRKDELLKLYTEMRSHIAPSSDIRRKTDACEAVTHDIVKVILERISGVDGDFDAEYERKRLRRLLEHDYAQSIYGSTAASKRSQLSSASHLASKRADAAAELAAKEAEYKIVQEEQRQKEKIKALEEEHKKQMAVQTSELERLKAEREVEAARARLDVYNRELSQLDDAYSVKTERVNPEHTPKHTVPSCTIPAPTAPPSVSQLAQAVQDSIRINRLPTPEPTMFSGEPIKFIEWKSTFMSLIEQTGMAAADKLYYLKRYVTGSARKCLEGTFFRNDEEAYNDAWTKLNQRYGQPFVLQRAFREKLSGWPKIQSRDADGLRNFADFVNACTLAMPHVKGLQILNDCEENQKLLHKLPDWINTRWNRHVTKILMDGGEFPSFSEFASFLSLEAEVACNPVTSIHALRSTETNDDKRNTREVKRNKASVFNINTTERDAKTKIHNNSSCTLCQESHPLIKCPDFLQMTLEMKRKHVKDNKHCYGCLKQGHSAKDCRRRLTCETCTKRHPTCLHDENYSISLQRERQDQVSIDNATQGNSPESATAMALNVARAEHTVSTSMIVPVWVSTAANPQREKLVYALLDTQSDTVFIDQDVTQKLQANVCPVKLKLTTMMGKNAVVSSGKVCDLLVRGYNSATVLRLPTAYTKDYIPANREHIPTCETAKLWSHLSSIVDEIPPLLSCEVSLLIGYTCPQALAPRQVILGKDNEPYAIQTDLGWSIVGNSVPCNALETTRSLCHRITVKEMPPCTPADAIRALEKDFKENEINEKMVSQDDLRFLEKLEQGITQTEKGHYEMPLPFKERPQMPDNRQLTESRLNKLNSKLMCDEKYKKDCVTYMNDIIQRVDVEETNDNGPEGETRNNAAPRQWFYVPTSENPADIASRGTSVGELLSSNWLTDPQFLWEKKLNLPTKESIELLVGDPEVRKVQTLNSQTTEHRSLCDRLTRFSSWSHAVSAIARLKRFLLRDKSKSLSTVTERQNAEMVIIKDLQGLTFSDEIKTLSKGKALHESNKMYNLDPFLDEDNVLKVGGRLQHSSLPNTFKHPTVIPRDHHITKLIIAHCHKRTNHQGKSFTMNEIRSSGYWIPKLSQTVSDYIHQCVTCRRLRRAVEGQKMKDLPTERVEQSPPFTYCGMDVFGPFLTKQARKENKRYALLFTCFYLRAVHVEMLEDLTTDGFINGLRCFIALRGSVRQIKCDRGTNFVGAKNELCAALNEIKN
ncbi:uncharacterized protein LOC109196819 [Oreochromis niloticus]|uniref:uncharacterized protein LOC109196819 n=1 Tax=Oreochromis niloticus TaxID=8128 RepID=UPI000DF321D7|nr:uncharacterized protein LOC109196819 [Oreochromis niloticus]